MEQIEWAALAFEYKGIPVWPPGYEERERMSLKKVKKS